MCNKHSRATENRRRSQNLTSNAPVHSSLSFVVCSRERSPFLSAFAISFHSIFHLIGSISWWYFSRFSPVQFQSSLSDEGNFELTVYIPFHLFLLILEFVGGCMCVCVWRSSECSAKRVRQRYTPVSTYWFPQLLSSCSLSFPNQYNIQIIHHALYYCSRMLCSALAVRWLDLFVRLFIAHSSSTLVLGGTYISCVRVVTVDIVEYHSLRENIQYMVDWRKWFMDSVLISHRKLLDEFRCTVKSETEKFNKSTNNISKHRKL